MSTRAILLAGIAALVALPAAAQDSDFRLPSHPAPTPTPQVIGPVLGNTPTPRPSPTPTPVPTPTATLPAPAVTPLRIPFPSATLTPTAPRRAPVVGTTPTTAPAVRPTQAAPQALPTLQPSPAPTAPTATTAAPSPLPGFAVAPSTAAPPQPARSYWPWIVFVFLLSAAGVGALLWLRRRIGPMGPVVVPEIERPKVPSRPAIEPEPEPVAAKLPPAPPMPAIFAEPSAPEPVAAAEPASVAPAAEANPLQINIELRKLTITLMNASLSYRLILTNAGGDAVEDIAIAADLVGAHSSLPREDLLASPVTELPQRHRLAGIAPGESGEVTGDLRIPLTEVRTITQGRVHLFVPLARFRIAAKDREPRCFTLVAGQPSPSGNGAVQPVRLDLGPRIYDGLAGRAF